jgi:hypothetical protein
MESACSHLAGGREGLDIGAVLRHFLPSFLAAHPRLPARVRRILERMSLCRSGSLGHTVYRCRGCGHLEALPLGCGDRHCPSCQASHARHWLEQQLRWLLPVPYFHLVFTLPRPLHLLLLWNQAALYKLFFEAASESLLELARSRWQATPGLTAVLHTWGQQLNYHPHLHVIMSAGALSDDGQQWHRSKQQRYLFAEAALAALFRGKFLAGLRALKLRWPKGLSRKTLEPLYQTKWRVYLKRPFGGPEQVLRYLANYTHRVAIANSRLRAIDEKNGMVTFAYRDYADGSRIKTLELDGVEFITRFCRHLLPQGFTKIRHYGILGNNRKVTAIPQVRLLLHSRATVKLLLALLALQTTPPPAPLQCFRCQSGTMRLQAVVTPWGTWRVRPLLNDSS